MLLAALGRRVGAFGEWARGRPFAAGCLLAASGAEIMLMPVVGAQLVVHTGVGGYAGFLLGLFLIAMGAAVCLAVDQRSVIAVLAVLAALAAFVLTNLGGMLIGSLTAIVGAALAFAWTPRADE